MTAVAQKRRAVDEATAPAGQEDALETGNYSACAKNASEPAKGDFAYFKWTWLEQVSTDPALPPAAHRVAILIASRYLNRATGEAWPSVGTLAASLSVKSENTIRTALKALESAGHLIVEWTRGGRNSTNHCWPTVGGKPFKNLKGIETVNPSKSDTVTLQNRAAKPFKNLKGNPLKEPSDKPDASSGGPSARPPSANMRRPSSEVVGSKPKEGARPQGAPSQDFSLCVGDNIEAPEVGSCEVLRFDNHTLLLRSNTTADYYSGAIDPQSGIITRLDWYEPDMTSDDGSYGEYRSDDSDDDDCPF